MAWSPLRSPGVPGSSPARAHSGHSSRQIAVKGDSRRCKMDGFMRLDSSFWLSSGMASTGQTGDPHRRQRYLGCFDWKSTLWHRKGIERQRHELRYDYIISEDIGLCHTKTICFHALSTIDAAGRQLLTSFYDRPMKFSLLVWGECGKMCSNHCLDTVERSSWFKEPPAASAAADFAVVPYITNIYRMPG